MIKCMSKNKTELKYAKNKGGSAGKPGEIKQGVSFYLIYF